jgi:Plasmid pRiA4b ORF-3-like protein
MQVYVFDTRLEADPGIRRRVVVRADQKLMDVHRVLQEAYEWADDHLYAFWLSGRFWDRQSREYTVPFELEPHQRSASTRLSRLGLERGQKLAYVFDFGDEWRVVLTIAAIEAADDGRYPRVIERQGDAPPQYPYYEEELNEVD